MDEPGGRFKLSADATTAERPVTRVRHGRRSDRLRAFAGDWAAALPLLLVLAIFLVAPIVVLLARSFITADGIGFSAYARVLSQHVNVAAILTSVELGLACAVISVLVGTPLAWLVSRMLAGRRATWLGVLNVAAHFGGVGLAFAYVASLGTFGMITLMLRGIGLPFDPPARDSLLALVLTYEHANIPLFVLLVVPAMGLLREEWSEAAESCGATRLQFWRRVGLPVIAPFLGAGFVLAFTWSIGVYGIAYALAGDSAAMPIQLVTLQIGQALADDAVRGPERAAVLSVVLMALAICALVVYRVLMSRGVRWFRGGAPGIGEARTESAAAGAPLRRAAGRASTRSRALAFALFGGFALYLAIPVIAVALLSIAGRWTSGILPDSFTLTRWIETFSSPRILNAFATSLSLAAWTTILVLVLTVPAVFWAHVRNRRIRPLLEMSAAIPFALPFVVIGFALLAFSGVFFPRLQGTYVLLLLAYVAVSFPFVYWTIDASMAAADVRRLAEAAAASGASLTQTLWRVVLPNIRSGLVTAAMLAFAMGVGEFALVKILAGSITTVSIWTARTMHSQGDGLGPVSVVTTVLFFLLFGLSAAIAWLNRRPSPQPLTGAQALPTGGAE